MTFFVRQYGDTDFITGLRAIAALMVIMIHTAAFRDFGEIGNTLTDNGKYGVQIFFVISGFTIARTLKSAGGFQPYFARRMMRIAPLYFVIITVAFVLVASGLREQGYWMTLYGSQADAYNLLMHFTFLSGWDARVANSLLGVEWSIPVEVFWYAVLPLILPVALCGRRRAIIFLGLLVLAGLVKLVEHLFLPPHAAHFNPLSYGAYFYLGALAETLRAVVQSKPEKTRAIMTYAAILAFGFALLTDTGMSSVIFALATAGLIVARADAGKAPGILARRPLLFLGSISYSLYLVHPLVLLFLPDIVPPEAIGNLAYFALTTAITVALSMLTYGLIERPSNRFGARWVRSWGAALRP